MTPPDLVTRFRGYSYWLTPDEIAYLGAGNSIGPGKGLNAYPPYWLWGNILPAIDAYDALRELYGRPMKVLAGYMTDEYAAAVGGTEGHTQFRILDVAHDYGGGGESKRLKGCAEILTLKGAVTVPLTPMPWGVRIGA